MNIVAMNDSYRGRVAEFIKTNWLEVFIISRGRKVYPAEIEGFVALDDSNNIIGFVTYEITGKQCEVVTLDALQKFQGIGTKLLATLIANLKTKDIKRLWLITTNDNVDAIRFYQKRGFTIAAVHVNAIAHSRMLKPSIPLIGCYGIPIRDEMEFELIL